MSIHCYDALRNGSATEIPEEKFMGESKYITAMVNAWTGGKTVVHPYLVGDDPFGCWIGILFIGDLPDRA